MNYSVNKNAEMLMIQRTLRLAALLSRVSDTRVQRDVGPSVSPSAYKRIYKIKVNMFSGLPLVLLNESQGVLSQAFPEFLVCR